MSAFSLEICMDYQALAKKHLQDALTRGVISLPDVEEGAYELKYRELKPSEILAVAKYVLKEGLLHEMETQEPTSSLPEEMLVFGEEDVEC
jgi:hypothetical protein